MQVDVAVAIHWRVPDAKSRTVARIEFYPWLDSYGRTHADQPRETTALIPMDISKKP